MAIAPESIRRVGISLGNIDRFVDGLGEFAQQLCSSLAARAPALRAQHGLELHFHVVPSLVGCFGDAVSYLPVRRSQEWWHQQPVQLDLWHTLAQLNRYPAPRGTGRSLCTVHDLNFVHVKKGLSLWRDTRRLRQLLVRNHAVVTISDYVRADLAQHLGWQGPGRTIYNGVRNLSAAPQEPVAGLGKQAFLFHISRMTPNKNVEALLNMMAQWPDQQLVLAGPSLQRNAQLQARCDALGLRNVRILAMVSNEQKAWLYAHCKAFVFPSLTEGFGLPPIEALYFGKPVLMSDRTCLPEVGGPAAHYWRNFDPAHMRSTAEAAITGFGPAQAEQARAWAGRYNWTDATQSYLDVYLQMLADSGPHGSV